MQTEVKTKDRPLLMRSHLVRATLASRKDNTRRTTGLDYVNRYPDEWELRSLTLRANRQKDLVTKACFCRGDEIIFLPCPYGKPGDRLWIKEPWGYANGKVVYRADGDRDDADWKSSLHMKRIHSRLMLTLSDIRVERLQDISAAGAIGEGIDPFVDGWTNYCHPEVVLLNPVTSFMSLWESINPGTWKTNPWVWVLVYTWELTPTVAP